LNMGITLRAIQIMKKELELRIYPDPILRKKPDPVFHVGGHERHLMKTMLQNLWLWNGVGLAAPQVGFSSQIIVLEAEGEKLAFANPVILESKGSEILEESCLSIPGRTVSVPRATSVWIRALDIQNRQVELKLEGFLARIIQHEIDHLNGKLIVDYDSMKSGTSPDNQE